MKMLQTGEPETEFIVLEDKLGETSRELVLALKQNEEELRHALHEAREQNPNVFYEIGYARGRGKPTILLAERGRELPFAVLGCR